MVGMLLKEGYSQQKKRVEQDEYIKKCRGHWKYYHPWKQSVPLTEDKNDITHISLLVGYTKKYG